MREPKKKLLILALSLGLVVVLVMAWAISDFRGFKNSFRRDTRERLIQLNIGGVIGDREEISTRIEMISYGGQIAGIRVPTMQLPEGAEAVFSVSLPRREMFSEGGGWIFSGHRYYGTHSIAAEILAVHSSNPAVVEASIDRTGGMRLRAVAPGISNLMLSVRSPRSGSRVPHSPVTKDSVEFTVVSSQ